jgi:hypothetical protein
VSVVSGIQCDWCGRIAKAEEDALGEAGWKRVTIAPLASFARQDTDLCPDCADVAGKAFAKAKKRRQTGRVQR